MHFMLLVWFFPLHLLGVDDVIDVSDDGDDDVSSTEEDHVNKEVRGHFG